MSLFWGRCFTVQTPEQTTRSVRLYESPKPTAQQSRRSLGSVLAGQMFATGSSGCRGSHTLTAPSRPPVTISGAPQFTVEPPIASSAFIIPSWAVATSYTGASGRSRSYTVSLPAKSPTARCSVLSFEAPNEQHLSDFSVSTSLTRSSVPRLSW
uniref:Uncharacterized protein n=1 Tax=Anopheles farauti TaxID=69004 RepID=A0A182QE12_9DIPT